VGHQSFGCWSMIHYHWVHNGKVGTLIQTEPGVHDYSAQLKMEVHIQPHLGLEVDDPGG